MIDCLVEFRYGNRCWGSRLQCRKGDAGVKKYLLLTMVALCSARVLGADTSSSSSSGVLSDEDLKRLVTEWKDEAKGVQYKLYATAEPRPLNAGSSAGRREIEKYKNAGESPYRVTATLYEFKTGDRAPRRANGTAKLYLVDADKRVVLQKSVSLSKMCPS